jgi:lipopolysaccharide transport system ATP-binding protein
MSSEAGSEHASNGRFPGPYAVEAEQLSKTYTLGEYASLRRTARAVMTAVTRTHSSDAETFDALWKASFEVTVGECFSVLGANGSGKSTLLRLISGITLPTGGSVRLRGRVLPLLNVGSGFHPELTGRENVFLFGTLLGLSQPEIQESMPEILDFAEIDLRHMATPVKHYSDGMLGRLSFATASRLPADVYVYDEVLAFGDDHFKAICLAQIEELVGDGSTVIFTSHELPLVKSICTRGLWLERGRVRMVGPIEQVVGPYAESQAPAPPA